MNWFFHAARGLPQILKWAKPVTAVAALVCLQLCFPDLWRRLGFAEMEEVGKKIAAKKFLAVFLIGALLFVVRGLGALVTGVPLPHYHDEFSYLLAADTFAHYRLTNATPPMWRHFETFHVIWHPTYMSMYPPGQGLILALGERLGNAWIGQLLASAMMCAGICWALQAWMPARWALLGGLLAVARLGLLSYFTNGYWSSCLPAVGGALVLGALPRIQQGAKRIDAVFMAVGLFILANTRPYEGLLLSVGAGAALLAWMFSKSGPSLQVTLTKIILPLVLMLIPLAAWSGYYNYRVTGSPFRMAYQLNRETYAMGRYFIWQKPWPQKIYSDQRIQDKYELEAREASENRTVAGFLRRGWEKVVSFWKFYLIAPLFFVLIGLPWAVRDRRLRTAWMIAGIFVAGLVVEVWFLPHYFAPALALLYVILLQCMRHVRCYRWRRRAVGIAFVRAVCVVYVATAILRIGLAMARVHPEKEWQHGDMERVAIVQKLSALPGKHLVLVKYPPGFDLDREWVYNWADIDGSKIVWARDMGPEKDQDLLDYYYGRQKWMAEPGAAVDLRPYGDHTERASGQ